MVISGLAVDNSRLSDLAQNARVEAENFDENNQLSQLVSLFEEWKSRIEMQFYYIAGILMALGAGTSAVGVLQVKDSLFSAVVEILSGALLIGGVTLVITYKILQHQVKTNSDLVTRFNQELSEKQGNIRGNDQDWHRIAAQFFWNKSLLSPTTHICLVLLSVIRALSPQIYGIIVADLRAEVQEFVVMSSREIIQQQVQRAIEREIPAWSKKS